MDIAAVRAALALACRTVVDAAGVHLEAAAFVPDSIDPPFAYPADVSLTFGVDLDGDDDAVVTLRVLTSRTEDEFGQRHLDALLAPSGSTSVRAAIEANPTLGGQVADLRVAGWSAYQLHDVAGNEYYGAELTIEVMG